MLLFIILSLLLPIAYIAVGLAFWKHTPEDMNGTVGWKTKRARQNRETWEYANSYGGKNIFVLGVVLFTVSIVLGIVFGTFNIDSLDWIVLLIVAMQMGLLGVIIYRVENRLEINFDKGRTR